jgi:hypothetical protein
MPPRAGVGQWRQRALQRLAQRLVLTWELEGLAQRLGRLVDVEADVARCQLEQHAVGLAEVDGVEVPAVDDRRGPCARFGDARTEGCQLLVVGRRPGDVVHRARALDGWAGQIVRKTAEVQVPVAARAAGVPAALRAGLHPQGLQQRRAGRRIARERPHPLEALQRVLRRDALGVCAQRRIGHRGGHEGVLQALGVGEVQQPACGVGAHALLGQAVRPEGQGLVVGDAPLDLVDHPGPGVSTDGARKLEEGQDGARGPGLVAVVQVVRVRRVVVHRLLDQPQPQHTGVEVHVDRGVGGDGGDVVEALELHRQAATGARRAAKSVRRPLDPNMLLAQPIAGQPEGRERRRARC